MKRKLLFSAAMLMMAAGAMAQEDITPSRYDFSNQEVGEYTIDAFNNGWGPNHFKDAKLEGYINLCGGAGWANADFTPTDRSKNFQKGLSIYDFGGNIGKVLVFKGVNCNEAMLDGVPAATGGCQVMWPQLSFYADSTKVVTGGENEAPCIRISLLYKAISNVAYAAQGGCIAELETKAATNTVLNTFAVTGDIPNMDMMISPDDEDYTLEQGWVKFEYDVQVGTKEGNPFAFTLKLANNSAEGGEAWLDHGAVLIKELNFTLGSDGEYKKGNAPFIQKRIDLSTLTGLNAVDKDVNAIYCTASDNVLSVANIKSGDKVEVYNAVGMKVASETAVAGNLTLPLNGKGLYIVSVGGKKSVKVFNN